MSSATVTTPVCKPPAPKKPRKTKAEQLTTQLLKGDEDKQPSYQDRSDSSVPLPLVPSLDGMRTQEEVSTLMASELKRKSSSPAQWYAHKKTVIAAHPELNAVEQLILAKKTYIGGNRLRSPISIHREAYLLRNPNHGLSGEELNSAIREDLISRI
jgi:hypothetical protein